MKELSGFPVGSGWKVLEPSSITPEPSNTFAFYEPADTDHLDEPAVPKQNFEEEWKRPTFTGRTQNTKEERVKGEPHARWIKEAGLTANSHPVEWVDAFLPVYEKYHKRRGETPHDLSVSRLCNWSNTKASLMEMGTKTMYPTFKPFSTQEWEKYLYLFFFNGLCPSPQIEMKLDPEEKNPFHSNAFLQRALGPAAPLRFQKWKCCFACQDPKLAIPFRKTHPNFKIDEYFRHLQKIFRYAWMPGKHLSGDEQTMGFQGNHEDKLRITYKKEEEGR